MLVVRREIFFEKGTNMLFRASVWACSPSPLLPNERNATRSLKEHVLDLREHAPFFRPQQRWRLRIDEHDESIDGIFCLCDVGNGISTRDRGGRLVYNN